MKRVLSMMVMVILIVSGLSACRWDDGGPGYYNTYCVNPYSHLRVDYSNCNTHSSWIYYVHAGDSVPAVGSRVSSYNKSHYSKPNNATVKTNGVPIKGGKAPKITTGPGVKIYKPPANNNNNNKPGNVYKPKPPAVRPNR